VLTINKRLHLHFDFMLKGSICHILDKLWYLFHKEIDQSVTYCTNLLILINNACRLSMLCAFRYLLYLFWNVFCIVIFCFNCVVSFVMHMFYYIMIFLFIGDLQMCNSFRKLNFKIVFIGIYIVVDVHWSIVWTRLHNLIIFSWNG
jgi:hypothetical protein